MQSDFFSILVNWVSMQATVIVFTYVAQVDSLVRNTYTQFGAYYTNTAVWFLPFNFYSDGLIYWDSASQVRSGNNYFNILGCGKFIAVPVKEKNDQVLTGGDTLVVYDVNGNIVPPKLEPNGQLYPVQEFSVRFPQEFNGLIFNFVENKGEIEFIFDEPNASYSNYIIKGKRTYTENDVKLFKLGIPLWRDSNLPYTINTRLIKTKNLDYIQSFQEAFCGATIVENPVAALISPFISNADFNVFGLNRKQDVGRSLAYYRSTQVLQWIYEFAPTRQTELVIVQPDEETQELYSLFSDVLPVGNSRYYGQVGKVLRIRVVAKDLTTFITAPFFRTYQVNPNNLDSLEGPAQGFYTEANPPELIVSPDAICFSYVTKSSSDTLYFRPPNGFSNMQILMNGKYIATGIELFNTQAYKIPDGAFIFINMRQVNGADILVDEYVNRGVPYQIGIERFSSPPKISSIEDSVGAIQTTKFYTPTSYNKLFYSFGQNTYDFTAKIFYLKNNIIQQIFTLTRDLSEFDLVPTDEKGVFICAVYANTVGGGTYLLNIIKNPGNFPLLINNQVNFGTVDVINMQLYPGAYDKDIYSDLVAKSFYPIYESGYYGATVKKYIISKFTVGIVPSSDSDCLVNVKDTSKNVIQYNFLRDFTASGPLPYEFLVTSKTIRQGIRMFNDIFRHENNLEREISAYASILVTFKSWTWKPQEGLYTSNTLLWPQLWPKFKYCAILGIIDSNEVYTQIFTDLERIIYYVPKPFTLRTSNDVFVMCREIQYRSSFVIECDKQLTQAVILVSNSASKTIHY